MTTPEDTTKTSRKEQGAAPDPFPGEAHAGPTNMHYNGPNAKCPYCLCKWHRTWSEVQKGDGLECWQCGGEAPNRLP